MFHQKYKNSLVIYSNHLKESHALAKL